MLWKIMETAYENGQYNAAVSAIKELNQLGGLSINRSQSININANLDSMNKDQIKERLGQILGANGSDYDPKDRQLRKQSNRLFFFGTPKILKNQPCLVSH